MTRYIPRDRSHMRTTEIELNSGAVMAPKKTDHAKKRWNRNTYISFNQFVYDYH